MRSILVETIEAERIEVERIECAARLLWPNMRFCILRTTLIGLLIFSLFARGFCQTATTPPRPKVGLVLEGGGALGLAHIGVIQWLEEHRIPVNYVTGTSMGGLVGGLYATGHSAPEIKELIKTINWDQVLAGPNSVQELLFSPQAGCGGIPESPGVRPQERSCSSLKDLIPARKS